MITKTLRIKCDTCGLFEEMIDRDIRSFFDKNWIEIQGRGEYKKYHFCLKTCQERYFPNE